MICPVFRSLQETRDEKIFPLNMPTIEKVELVKQAKVRRSKLYYLRDYKKKLSETLLS